MTDIPLDQPKTPDIYSFGFDKNLNRTLVNDSTGVVYDTIQDAINTGSVLSGGNLTLKTLSIGGLVRQVAPGDDIQAAINAISSEGGGTVQLLADTYILKDNIEMKPKVSLVGAGIDVTILEFQEANYGVRAVGASTSIIDNFSIQSLTIQNSGVSAGGLFIQFADFWQINNIRIHSCGGVGVNVSDCQNFTIYRCRASSNGGAGYYVLASDTRQTRQFSFISCLADSNTGSGFRVNCNTNDLFWGSYVACESNSNQIHGYSLETNGSGAIETSFIGCIANANTSAGFSVASGVQRARFMNCMADTNGGYGFDTSGAGTSIIGCISGDGFNIQGETNLIGNDSTSASSSPTSNYTIAELQTQSYLNLNESPYTLRRNMLMQNNSGATLRAGNVVILASDSTGESITTTSTNGHNKVFGVVGDTTSTNGSWCVTLVEGRTSKLFVANGTTSIVIGDWLSAYSHAYYAKKAVTGDMVFAFALSSPSTSTAQINALIVTPRLI